MKVWQCEVFANEEMTRPCVSFIGRFADAEEATEALQDELSQAEVILYPGPMREAADDGSLSESAPFRMVRMSSGAAFIS